MPVFKYRASAAVALAVLIAAISAAPAAAQGRSDVLLADMAASTVRQYAQFSIFDDVSVTVADRAITVNGRVTMPFKRDEIGKRISRIDGVRSVTNNIQVLPVSHLDETLRMRLAQAIYNHPAFWGYASMANPPIHIVVEHGYVTLTGCVNNQGERTLAFALAQIDGVLGVKNELRVDKD